MSMHTPGPWMGWFRHAKTTAEEPSHGLVTGPPWISTKGVSGYTNPADVKLIAAAPEMLEALKGLVSYEHCHCSPDPDVACEHFVAAEKAIIHAETA